MKGCVGAAGLDGVERRGSCVFVATALCTHVSRAHSIFILKVTLYIEREIVVIIV